MFEQTPEWWSAKEADGRTRAEMYPFELERLHGEVGIGGWNYRRRTARRLHGEQIVFPPLSTGMAAHVSAGLSYTPPTKESCPLPADELKKLLATSPSLIDLANHFDCSPSRVQSALGWLQQNHLMVAETAEGITLATSIERLEPHAIDTAQFSDEEFCFGITADNHVGSKYARLDVLNDLADRWHAQGVSKVFVAGNWIDGSGRRFNQHDIYVAGVDGQVANFIEKLPKRKGLEWDILSGDDHEGWFVQDEHVNIGHVLEDEAKRAGRLDIHDLGYMERDIELVQPHGSARIRIAHMGGGSAYALSYSMQKYVESLQGGEKPNVIIGGHYHKFDYNYAREVHLIQPGCTQDQTPFMRKKKLQAMVGGCTLWIRQNELGIITSCKVEWMPYYDQKYYAYRWGTAK